jgi:pimeloyl-ACP methyl ester carboxylesterase
MFMLKTTTYIILLFIILCTPIYIHAQTMLGPERIEKNTAFTKAKSPYVISHNISIQEGVTVTVENGAKLIFDGGSLFFKKSTLIGNNFSISIQGNPGQNSFMISGDNSRITLSHVDVGWSHRSFVSAWNSSTVSMSSVDISSLNKTNTTAIQIFDNSKLLIDDSSFANFSKVLDIFNFSYATVTDSVLSQNTHAVYTFDSHMFIRGNDFTENKIAVEFFTNTINSHIVDAQNNWWGSAHRPIIHMNISDIGQEDINVLVGNVIYTPWSLTPHKKPKQGDVSNILFLPGLMGSRLYQKGTFENQLWEPNRNKDVKKLFLNGAGESIETNIYTRDVLAKTNIAGGVTPIEQTPYKDFFTYMDGLVNNDIIQSWKPAPYDWRYSPDTILDQGIFSANTKGETFTSSLVGEVLLLAKTSKTKKVTLVTHSNGGLVGKQLMIELKKRNLDSLVDKIIFVAMPEYGTPQAVTSLLYGHEQAIAGGLILSSDIAQKLGVNMPTAYTLLPSQKYFAAGNAVSVGKESVTNKPTLNVKLTEKAYINNNILHKADQFHQIVDEWVPSTTTQVHQIVGTGLLTVSGFTEKSDTSPVPIYTTSGDGVVQDMYNKDTLTYARTGNTVVVDLHSTKHTHMNIMNNTNVMTQIDVYIRKTQDIKPNIYPIYNNVYTLFNLSSGFSTTSTLSKKNIQAQKYLYKDTLSYIPQQQFQTTQTESPLSRYDVFGGDIQYITQEHVKKFEIVEHAGDTLDMRVINKTNDATHEFVYENVKLFPDSGLVIKDVQVGGASQTHIEITLPAINQKIEITPTKEIMYDKDHNVTSEIHTATSTEDVLTKILRIQGLIKLSNITSYVKSRYISRLDILAKNITAKKATEVDLTPLQQKAEQSVRSIQSFSNSPALKGRYSKLKQDYIYLSYILK